MRIRVLIKEIDFCHVILKAMPLLEKNTPDDGSAISKIISVVTQLPPEIIRTMLEAVSEEDQRQIVTLLANENKEKVRQTLSQLLQKNGIDISLDAISLNEQLELSANVTDVNYDSLAAQYLPLLRDSIDIRDNLVIGGLLNLPKVLLLGALARVPQDKKNEIMVSLVNKNKTKIMTKIEEMLADQDIHIRLGDLCVEL